MTAGAVTENGSGVARYLFYVDNNSANATVSTTNSTSVTTTTGNHAGYCVVVDKAGNQSTAASQSDARTKMWQYGLYSGGYVGRIEVKDIPKFVCHGAFECSGVVATGIALGFGQGWELSDAECVFNGRWVLGQICEQPFMPDRVQPIYWIAEKYVTPYDYKPVYRGTVEGRYLCGQYYEMEVEYREMLIYTKCLTLDSLVGFVFCSTNEGNVSIQHSNGYWQNGLPTLK